MVTKTPTAAADTYGRDETIEVTVNFDQAVTVTGAHPASHRRFLPGEPEVGGDYADGMGTTVLRFSYVVQTRGMDDCGIYIEENEPELNGGGTIQGVDDAVAAGFTYDRPGARRAREVDGSPTTTGAPFRPQESLRDFPVGPPPPLHRCSRRHRPGRDITAWNARDCPSPRQRAMGDACDSERNQHEVNRVLP